MIYIDRRVGSVDLCEPLLAAGLPAQITELEYADLAFEGQGAKGTTLSIGIELKNINDMVGSLRSGRLAGHQLPGLRQTYDRAWVLCEGQWRHDDVGNLVSYQGKYRGWKPLPGKMSAFELEKQLLTIELCGGVHVRHCTTRRDSLRFIGSLYRWFTDKAMDAHTSHLAVHNPPVLVAVSDFRQAVMRWPGIGLKASKAVEVRFKSSIARAGAAGVDEWAAIETVDDKGKTRRLGTSVATKLVTFLKGE